jgi:UDP-glucose 4-epimerase
MARVLITGGAGFIGSHLATALVERGDQVRVLDNFSTGKHENLAAVRDQLELLDGDLRNPEDVERAVAGIDLVFHLAAFISVPASIESPKACFDVNVRGTAALLEAARHAGVASVVLASSAAVYGARAEMPLKEEFKPECLSPYAASKQFTETLAQLYWDVYKLPIVALRFFNVYGPRQAPDSQYAAVIPKFIDHLKGNQAPIVLGDGSQTRDFIFITDVVRAMLLAAESAQGAGGAFNVCSGKETSLLDLLEVLYSLFPAAPKPQFEEARLGDVPRSLGDPQLAARLLGFEAQTHLPDGLRRSVEALAG